MVFCFYIRVLFKSKSEVAMTVAKPMEDAFIEIIEGVESIGIILPWWFIAGFSSKLIHTYIQECKCLGEIKSRPFRILFNGAQIADSPPKEVAVKVGDVITNLCRCGAPLKLEIT